MVKRGNEISALLTTQPRGPPPLNLPECSFKHYIIYIYSKLRCLNTHVRLIIIIEGTAAPGQIFVGIPLHTMNKYRQY